MKQKKEFVKLSSNNSADVEQLEEASGNAKYTRKPLFNTDILDSNLKTKII